MGSLLCLFGADGSGKTTIARYVVTYLRTRGIDATVVWMRGTHTLASILAKILAHFPVFHGSCNPYYRICIPSKMKWLWLWIEFISILPIILLRYLTPKLLGRMLVAERSFMDFLVWLMITLKRGSIARGFIGKTITSFTYSLCDRIVYVRADLNALISRRRDFSKEYLIPVQLQIYDTIAKALKTLYIDTSRKSISESIREVLKIIGVQCE